MLAQSELLGEGHRNVIFRLRAEGIRVRNRVVRLMREQVVLVPVRGDTPAAIGGTAVGSRPRRPTRSGHRRNAPLHQGGWLLLVLPRCRSLGHRLGRLALAMKKGDRWAALEPRPTGVRGGTTWTASPLGLRHDSCPQHVAHQLALALDPLDPVPRGRAGVQSTREALHPDAQRRPPVSLHDFQIIEGAERWSGLRQALPPRVDSRTAWV